MSPIESDFNVPITTVTTIEVTLKGYGGQLVFARAGPTLSPERPVTTGNLGPGPRWEIEWLARVVAEKVLRDNRQ